MNAQQILLQKINALQPDRGHYKCYQAFGKIELKGQRPVEERFAIYKLNSILTLESTVLDIGSNIGCMALYVSEFVKEVHGVESYKSHVTISNLIRDFLYIGNCKFYHQDILKFKNAIQYDVLLSLAAHPKSMKKFQQFVNLVYRPMLKIHGHLLIESRDFKGKHEPFFKYIAVLVSNGFVVDVSGSCQCENDKGEKNQFREFKILRKVPK